MEERTRRKYYWPEFKTRICSHQQSGFVWEIFWPFSNSGRVWFNSTNYWKICATVKSSKSSLITDWYKRSQWDVSDNFEFSFVYRILQFLYFSEEAKQLLVKGARFLNKLNVTCLIEPLSIRPNYYLRSYDTALQLIKELNEPNLKIMFDTYHLQRLHGNISHYLEVLILLLLLFNSLPEYSVVILFFVCLLLSRVNLFENIKSYSVLESPLFYTFF